MIFLFHIALNFIITEVLFVICFFGGVKVGYLRGYSPSIKTGIINVLR
jgi:hypothetical protein